MAPSHAQRIREDVGEALIGERVGQPLSREILTQIRVPTLLLAEGKTGGRVIASVRATRRGLRPWHARTLLAREPGDLRIDQRWSDAAGSASGRRGAVADDARAGRSQTRP